MLEPRGGQRPLGAGRRETQSRRVLPEVRKMATSVPLADAGLAGMATGDMVFGGNRGGSWEDVDTRLLECSSPAAASPLIKFPNPELACCPEQRALLSQEFLWQD